MFTGIVTAVGTVRQVVRGGDRLTITIAAPYEQVSQGESIAVGGVCLTVTARGDGWFSVDAVATTRTRTRVTDLSAGDSVNLERALAVGDRLGGHFVQGHVDGVAEVVSVEADGDQMVVDLCLPPDVAQVSVSRGSITVDGASLTISELLPGAVARIALIPFTRDHTTLGRLRVGDRVNVEGDVLGKYVRALLEDRSAVRE